MSRQLNTSCFETFPVLKTDRLTLRELKLDDAKELFAMRSNTRNNQFMLRPNMEEPEGAEASIEKVQKGYEQKTLITWAGLLREQDQMIGTCGFNKVEAWNMRAEIGGELFVNYWGKNIAFEAVRTIIQYGFEGMDLQAIEAKVNPANRGAIFILEQMGFEREGYFKQFGYYQEEWHDLAMYTCFNPRYHTNP